MEVKKKTDWEDEKGYYLPLPLLQHCINPTERGGNDFKN